VLFLSALFPATGRPMAGIFVLRQIQALQRLGVAAKVMTIVPVAPPISKKWAMYASIPSEYTWEGIPCLNVRAVVPPRMVFLEMVRRQFEPRLLREIERFRPDVIHAHFVLPTGVMCSNLSVPVVLTAHGGDAYSQPWQRRDLEQAARKAVTSATKVTAVSRYIAAQVKRLGREDVTVVYNGGDETTFHTGLREDARQSLRMTLTQPVIVFAGHLLAAKGVFDLVTAAAQLPDLKPLIIFAGDGPDRGRLESACRSQGVQGQFVGTIQQVELAELFRAADLVALPSYREGLPAVVCEAMLAGRVVVATPVGGIPEIIIDNETGVLVPARDSSSLAHAIGTIIRNHDRRERMERQARAFSLAHLTWRANAEAYINIYDDAIARQASATL
jgi:glycosyltransferase involved in cell wall biosynthesis